MRSLGKYRDSAYLCISLVVSIAHVIGKINEGNKYEVHNRYLNTEIYYEDVHRTNVGPEWDSKFQTRDFIT